MAPRHEFRLGNRELIAFAGVVVLICALTFLFGILVGREMTPAPRVATRTDRDRLDDPGTGTKAVPVKGDDHLTFYKTLTAPTAEAPPRGKPTIEEHLVPRDEGTPGSSAPPAPALAGASAPLAPVGGSEASLTARPSPPSARRSTSVGGSGSATLGRSATPRATAAGPRPVSRVAAAAPVMASGPVAPASSPASAGPASGVGGGEPTLWTVQVSSFRNRPLAEDLRARLTARGLEAYLLPSAEGGQVRYRVRIGAYPSRGEAERLAAELGSERTLTPFVTPRVR